VPWVSELLSEFFEVFQDPLPPGLPPERSEGHSIPSEPGHPPPFWSIPFISVRIPRVALRASRMLQLLFRR
jgi:hypothetical protein